MPLALTPAYDASRLRVAARGSKDANQTRRLLTLAAIYDGATRTQAAAIGGVTVQIVRDWVVKLNTHRPAGLIDRKGGGPPTILTVGHRRALATTIEEGPILAVYGARRLCSGSTMPANPSRVNRKGFSAFSFIHQDGVLTTLTEPEPPSFQPTGITDAGQIIGTFRDADDQWRGFALNGTTVTILNVPRATETSPKSMNDAGAFVGFYTRPGRFEPRGFLYQDGDFTRIDVPGAQTRPSGINDAGQIAGSHLDAANSRLGFVASPVAADVPEPGTLLLLGLALAGAYAVRQERLTGRWTLAQH